MTSNGSSSLNANASEWKPPVDLLTKLNVSGNSNNSCSADVRQQPNSMPSLNPSTSMNLRYTLQILYQDESQYAVRTGQFMESIVNRGVNANVCQSIADDLVQFAEEDATRASLTARISNTLCSGILSKNPSLTQVLQDCVIQRASLWRSQVKWDSRPEANNFLQFLASLYATLTPRNSKIGNALCTHLEAAIRSSGSLFYIALDLAEKNMLALIGDWVEAGERGDAEVEGLSNALRDILTRSRASTACKINPQCAALALSALEKRAAEMARLRVYAELNISHQGSEMGDDIYDDYEKFLIETGQM